MDASVILQIKPELTRFLHQFDGYFGRVTTRRYLDLYVQGQLGPLPRKSIEPMADAFGEPPRNLQEFLSLFRWDEQGVRNELQQYVVRRHGSAQSVLAYSPRIREIPWETYHVKDGAKGPLVWQAKRLLVYLPDEQGLPTRPYHLLVARNVLDLKEIKYFLSNAPESTSVPTLLRVAFTRWIIERAFEDSKTELGMDHFEVRKFGSIQRHLILSCLSHVFLSEFCLKHRGEKSGPDVLPDPHGHGTAGAVVDAGWTLFAEVCRTDRLDGPGSHRPASRPQRHPLPDTQRRPMEPPARTVRRRFFRPSHLPAVGAERRPGADLGDAGRELRGTGAGSTGDGRAPTAILWAWLWPAPTSTTPSFCNRPSRPSFWIVPSQPRIRPSTCAWTRATTIR